jgi:hypothetical protein
MANEKEPSIYYDRSTIGSSGELDEYGVWVKSEPRDLSELSLPDSVSGVEDELLPIEDFSIEEEYPAGDLAENSVEDPTENSDETEEGFTGVFFEDFPEDTANSADITGSLEPQSTAEMIAEAASRGSPQEFSTQLLIKIADELASIRVELSALKKEFSTIRPGDSLGEAHDEDKGEIALTGDEIDKILNTTDAAEEAGFTEEIEEKIPMEAVPEDFTLDDAGLSPDGGALDNVTLDEPALDEAALDEPVLTDEPLEENGYPEENPPAAPEEAELENISLDDLSFDDDTLDEPDLGIAINESSEDAPPEGPLSTGLDSEESA